MNSDRGSILLAVVRAVISKQLGIRADIPKVSENPWLSEPAATFITLKKSGELRGCIGSLKARRSLIDDLQDNAISAAFHDPRFEPLSVDELDNITIEVSLLTEPEAIRFSSENDALAQLRPHIDGVIFEYGMHRGTFLPQVWEQLPDPAVFMAHLKQKAGLPPSFWSDEAHLYRYTVEKFGETGEKADEQVTAYE